MYMYTYACTCTSRQAVVHDAHVRQYFARYNGTNIVQLAQLRSARVDMVTLAASVVFRSVQKLMLVMLEANHRLGA